jgi:hypothetical protein
MTFATIMASETKIININDELKSLTSLFETNGWKKNINDVITDNIIYSKQGNETEFFEITLVDNSFIYVSVPLKNSTFQFKTKFSDYYSAIKYTESKFHYFIGNENICF